MISNPASYVKAFVNAGSNFITFHNETVLTPQKFIAETKSLGVKVGVALKPLTPLETIENILASLDLILIMSVEPGFGGQKFLPEVLTKITRLRSHPECPADISIDGGINLETAQLAVKAGANILVAGSAIFAASDPPAMIRQLKQIR
jgi:ribulose-phosphate 3-epimerase